MNSFESKEKYLKPDSLSDRQPVQLYKERRSMVIFMLGKYGHIYACKKYGYIYAWLYLCLESMVIFMLGKF